MPVIDVTASGESYSAGIATATDTSLAVAVGAEGTSQSHGDATIALTLPAGGLTDFGIWDQTGIDPAISCLMATVAGTPNGRAQVAATAPIAYTTALGTLWNAAVAAAVRMLWSDPTDTETSTIAVTAVQIESITTGNLLPPDAADYRTRLAYTAQLNDAAVTRTSAMALSGTWAGRMVNSGSLSPYTMWPMDVSMVPCTPGDLITGSVFLALPRAGAQWAADLHFYNDAQLPITPYTSGTTATHPGGYAWQKASVQETVPDSAAYVAVVPHVVPAATGDGEIAYVDCHRITSGIPALSLAPSAYQPARQQNINVLPNRINLMFNPGFNTNVDAYYGIGGPDPVLSWDDTVGRTKPGAAKLVCTPGTPGWPQIGSQAADTQASRGMALLEPGATYTVSGWIRPALGIPEIGITVQIDADMYFNGSTTTDALADAALQDDGFLRLFVTFTVPQTSSGNTSVIFGMNPAGWTAFDATVTYWLDDVLCERTPVLTDYFDGAEPSVDYVWAGTQNASPSLYYRDYRQLQYRLTELVSQAVPLGVPYALNFTQPYS